MAMFYPMITLILSRILLNLLTYKETLDYTFWSSLQSSNQVGEAV